MGCTESSENNNHVVSEYKSPRRDAIPYSQNIKENQQRRRQIRQQRQANNNMKLIQVQESSAPQIKPPPFRRASLPYVQSFDLVYELLDRENPLGQGSFAVVYLARHRFTLQYYACKVIEKRNMKSRELVEAELRVLCSIEPHPNIVQFIEALEDEHQFYLIMELCSGGDVFQRIMDFGQYSEQAAASCCLQLGLALQNLHKNGIVHRDLKPENIMLSSTGQLKITDFGLSKLIDRSQQMLHTICGTPIYCAPEILSRRPYTLKADIWSLGILMYILLSGYHPFDPNCDRNEPMLLQRILHGTFDFNDDVWTHVSDSAKSLLRQLLCVDPAQRLSLEEYFKSSWIQGHDAPAPLLLPLVVTTRLQQYSQLHSQWRGIVVAKIAARRFRESISRSPRITPCPSPMHRSKQADDEVVTNQTITTISGD